MSIRITWTKTTSSGRRESWARTFYDVISDYKGARAFIGEYLSDGCETDLPIGTLVLEVVPTGSVKNGSQEARIYRVTEADLELVADGLDWRKQYLSVVDRAKELLAEPQQQIGARQTAYNAVMGTIDELSRLQCQAVSSEQPLALRDDETEQLRKTLEAARELARMFERAGDWS